MPTNPLERMALALVLAGLCAFVALNLAAPDAPTPAQGYEIVGGTAYSVDPMDSKAFRTNLERYQGKTGVMLYELGLWWEGLWRGKALGSTVFALCALGAAGLVLWAHFLSPIDDADNRPGGGTDSK